MTYQYSEAARTLDETVPLVTQAELLLICKEIDEDTPTAETTQFILTAHVLLYSKLDGYGLSAELLKQIEKYLAAHFAACTYPATSRETLGPLSKGYVTKVDLDLRNTRYGQMAIALDPTLELATNKRAVVMRSLGSGILTQWN